MTFFEWFPAMMKPPNIALSPVPTNRRVETFPNAEETSGVGDGVGDGLAIAVGAGVADGPAVAVAVGPGDEVGDGVDDDVGVVVGVGDADEAGVGVGKGVAVALGPGVGLGGGAVGVCWTSFETRLSIPRVLYAVAAK